MTSANPGSSRRTAFAAFAVAVVVMASLTATTATRAASPTQLTASPAPSPARKKPLKHVLAWADVRNGYQHEAINHAMATIERLGWESGEYDTYIRTDSQLITKRPITFKTGTGIATGEQFLVRDLNYFDAIFFFGVREIDLTPEQRADLLAFVSDGKGFVAAHSAITAFFSWPEFGEMLGGRFDEHPWGITDATVIVDDRKFPAMQRFRPGSVVHDEHYQLKEFSRSKLRVLAHLDPATLDMTKPLIHRTDGDFPVAWAKNYGKGRVFYSTLGHVPESWDTPLIQQMYFDAIRWALRLVDGDATPLPPPKPLPAGDGRDAVVKMCSGCHGIATSTGVYHTRLEWMGIVDLMRQQGAKGTEDDAEAASAYLASHFGKVNINTANEAELVRILEIPQAAAAAIVAYRRPGVVFQQLDDLRKVPGLDFSLVEPKEGRIQFPEF
jgi:type 1 glutamine amidotransferase